MHCYLHFSDLCGCNTRQFVIALIHLLINVALAQLRFMHGLGNDIELHADEIKQGTKLCGINPVVLVVRRRHELLVSQGKQQFFLVIRIR